MKTTLEIRDVLMLRAKRLSKRSGRPLRALVEEGLRRVLETDEALSAFRLEDGSVGNPQESNPLDGFSWQDLRSEIYGPGSQR